MIKFALLLAAVTATPFSLKGWQLGDDIETLRASPLPNTQYSPAHFECSDTSALPSLKPDDMLAAAGVVRCHAVETIGGSVVFSDLSVLGDTPVYADFLFLKRKLFRIEIYADRSHTNDMLTALSQKYGAPTVRRAGTFQVRSGASFPQEVVTWRHQGQTLTLTSPDAALERLSLIYSDDAASSAVAGSRAQGLRGKNDL